jgi:hypothetical protein
MASLDIIDTLKLHIQLFQCINNVHIISSRAEEELEAPFWRLIIDQRSNRQNGALINSLFVLSPLLNAIFSY